MILAAWILILRVESALATASESVELLTLVLRPAASVEPEKLAFLEVTASVDPVELVLRFLPTTMASITDFSRASLIPFTIASFFSGALST